MEKPRTRMFTLSEATELLPQISAGMRKLMDLSLRLDQTSGARHADTLLVFLTILRELESMGVEVKSIQEGLVDFPHVNDGVEVRLCWRYGEREIKYWHNPEAGFDGRVPLGARKPTP